MITFEQVCLRLDENKISYMIDDLENGFSIIVSSYGGRIFGPFRNKKESCCWINPVFKNKSGFKEFVSGRSWNIGGDRIWLEPEIQYNVPEPEDFWGSYTVPDDLDPGHYQLERDSDKNPVLSQEMNLKVHDGSSGKKKLQIERSIISAENPVPYLDIEFCGYHHQIGMKEFTSDSVFSGAWNLLQLKPDGVLHIPTIQEAGYVDYYDPITMDYQSINKDSIEVKIDARCQYKVGYSSLDTIGRSGYVSTYLGKPYLLIRIYGNSPIGDYIDEKLDKKLNSGISLRVYNDNGKMGDFAEHECSCLPIGNNQDRSENMETISNLFFFGKEDVLKEVGKRFLGLDLEIPGDNNNKN